MSKKIRAVEERDCEDLADQVAERVLEAQRQARQKSRRHFWSRLGYLLMLIGAASGLLTLLVALWGLVS